MADLEKAIIEFQKSDGLTPSNVRPRIYDRLKREAKPVHPDAAWEEAEALRAALPWMTGLLGLLASGHYAEASGVIAMSVAELSCERLLRMLNSFPEAIYVSPFDAVIDPEGERLPTAFQLTPFAEFGGVVPASSADDAEAKSDADLPKFVAREAARLVKRREARTAWTLPDDVHEAFANGRTAWHKSRASTKTLNGFIRYAALVGVDSTLSPTDRKRLWRDFMTRWAFSQLPDQEDGAVTAIQFLDLISNPTSTLARQFQIALQYRSHGKDELARLATRALNALKAVQINQPMTRPA